MYEVIKELGQTLNHADILWGVGGSLLLKTYSIVDEVHDIDIIIAKCDIDKAIKIMNQIAILKETPIKKEYHTDHFYTYDLNGVHIDVMSSFKIGNSCGIFEFILDKEAITKYVDYQDTLIPFTSLEDWLIAYQLMVNREVKVSLIKQYLEANGVLNPHLLKRALTQTLPLDTKSMIITLLK